MSKIAKETVLYIHRAGTQYTCSDCIFFRRSQGVCAIFHSNDNHVKPYGACGLWIERFNRVSIPLIGAVTKTEAGYVENDQGFSCKRCDEFLPSGDCKKVDKDSAGDDPGEINKNACCNRWSPDKERASMTNAQLMAYLKEQAIPAKKQEPAADRQELVEDLQSGAGAL